MFSVLSFVPTPLSFSTVHMILHFFLHLTVSRTGLTTTVTGTKNSLFLSRHQNSDSRLCSILQTFSLSSGEELKSAKFKILHFFSPENRPFFFYLRQAAYFAALPALSFLYPVADGIIFINV